MTKISRLQRSTGFSGTTKKTKSTKENGQGRYDAGILNGVSLCSRGPALGHGFWCDLDFIDSIADDANTAAKPIKSRFTHPGLCADGLGKALGTIENVSSNGDKAVGDLSFFKTATDTPDGDLAKYVRDLAEEAPEQFGLSIVFEHDHVAEIAFGLEHGAEWVDTDFGRVLSYAEFKSPDPLNVENLPHCRLLKLRACDVVDEPAANPGGLFHRENSIVGDGSKLLDFVFKNGVENPNAVFSSFGVDIDPERIKSFVSGYLAANGLTVATKGNEMSLKPNESDLAKKAPDADPAESEPSGGEKVPKTGSKKAPDADPSESEPSGGEGKPVSNKSKTADKKAPDADPSESTPNGGEAGGDDPGIGTKDESADDDSGDDNASKKKMEKKPDMEPDDDKEVSGCSGKPDASLAEYCEAFGHEDGAKFFLAGKSFKAAQTAKIKSLTAENIEQKRMLDAFAKTGVKPVGFTAAADKPRDKTNGQTERGSFDEPIDNRAKFAALNATTTDI
jgi:hypothetical protein